MAMNTLKTILMQTVLNCVWHCGNGTHKC